MLVLSGAVPFAAAGDPTGGLVVHDFTGAPQSRRGSGEFLAAAGLSMRCPRLPRHRTCWQDMAHT